jgi:hypothetical protein
MSLDRASRLRRRDEGRRSMEFNMLTFTKQDSILIAVTLGIFLSIPLLISAFYGSSTITLPDHASDRPGHLSERNEIGGDHGGVRPRGPGLDGGLSFRVSI